MVATTKHESQVLRATFHCRGLFWDTKLRGSEITKHIYNQPVRETQNDCGVNVTLLSGYRCPTPLHGKYEETPEGPDDLG